MAKRSAMWPRSQTVSCLKQISPDWKHDRWCWQFNGAMAQKVNLSVPKLEFCLQFAMSKERLEQMLKTEYDTLEAGLCFFFSNMVDRTILRICQLNHVLWCFMCHSQYSQIYRYIQHHIYYILYIVQYYSCLSFYIGTQGQHSWREGPGDALLLLCHDLGRQGTGRSEGRRRRWCCGRCEAYMSNRECEGWVGMMFQHEVQKADFFGELVFLMFN